MMSGRDAEISRRQFLTRLSLGLSALATAVVSVPMIAYVLSPLLERTPASWRSLGPADEFPVGDYRLVSFQDPSPLPWAGTTAQTAVYVRRLEGGIFQIFSVHCAHLGCPVNWVGSAQLFFCPCHGGVYYADGERASGPPPRGLFPYQYRIRLGQLEILTRPLPIATQEQDQSQASKEGP